MNNGSAPRNKGMITTQAMSDYGIVERILLGEIELFEILIRRHNQLLYRSIRSYLDRDVDVEDIMQEAYIKAFQKLYQFKNEAMFSTWLVRIGINEALRFKQKSKKFRTIDLTQESDVKQIADTSIMNPENKTIHRESVAIIEKAIDALPPKYKIVYILQQVEGMHISEISESLDLTNSNVKVRLHRARNMMKDYAEKWYGA